MAYLDKDGIPRVPEEQEIYNNEISEIHMRLDHICQELRECEILPSLTLRKGKDGCNPLIYKGFSHLCFGIDMCYIFLSFVLVYFIMLRILDFEMNS